MSCIFNGEYHDVVWGTPVTDSKELFAQLSLCTQQCGVSWRIVWNKRHHYGNAFYDWDMRKVAAMSEADLDGLCDKEGLWAGKLIQNRGKLNAIIHNARQCVAIDDAVPGGLSAFLWDTVRATGGEKSEFEVRINGLQTPLVRDPASVNASSDHTSEAYQRTCGVTSAFSNELTSRLKRKADELSVPAYEPFKFLGSVTIQAFMLQCGLINGHSPRCCKNPRCDAAAGGSSGSAPRAAEPPSTSSASTKRRVGAAASQQESTPKKPKRSGSSDDVFL